MMLAGDVRRGGAKVSGRLWVIGKSSSRFQVQSLRAKSPPRNSGQAHIRHLFDPQISRMTQKIFGSGLNFQLFSCAGIKTENLDLILFGVLLLPFSLRAFPTKAFPDPESDVQYLLFPPRRPIDLRHPHAWSSHGQTVTDRVGVVLVLPHPPHFRVRH